MNESGSGPNPVLNALDQLRLERRSYIIGSLVVWVVIWVTVLILVASMLPQLPRQSTLQAAIEQFAKVSASSRLLLDVVVLVGAVALFFLNWRFSALLRRPRGAFSGPGVFPPRRWMWWAVLALNSMFYISLIIPQLVVTAVLARWGSEEIARRSAPPPVQN
jgi:hypothetical protein